MINYEIARSAMVEMQLAHRNITNKSILKAFSKIPRESFLRKTEKSLAYEDHPLPIGHEQTISQPYITALMTELLMPGKEDRVLEIGTGSGYQAAILGELSRFVITVERISELAQQAKMNLKSVGIENVRVITADGTLGWKENAPYDCIMVTAGSAIIPNNLINQLKVGGRMVVPVGEAGKHNLKLILKEENKVLIKEIIDCSFVPLLGKGL